MITDMFNSSGTISKNVANLHREPAHDSEMVTQAIMGRVVVIKRDEGEWLHVRTWDGYQGWIQSRWVSRTIPHPADMIAVTSLFTDALSTPDPDGNILTKLVITTTLELVETGNHFACVRLAGGETAWLAVTDIARQTPIPLPSGADVIHTAGRFMGVPYLWGGTTPFGIDCSGFTQLVYRINGICLPRDAWMQAEDQRGTSIDREDLQAGDLVFFAGGEDRNIITHVGMACGDGSFIHSSGKGVGVWLNSLDDVPYVRTYWGARRMLPQQTPISH